MFSWVLFFFYLKIYNRLIAIHLKIFRTLVTLPILYLQVTPKFIQVSSPPGPETQALLPGPQWCPLESRWHSRVNTVDLTSLTWNSFFSAC